jgi:hypothetical protein
LAPRKTLHTRSSCHNHFCSNIPLAASSLTGSLQSIAASEFTVTSLAPRALTSLTLMGWRPEQRSR